MIQKIIREHSALKYVDIVWKISRSGICADETIVENARRKVRSKIALDKNTFFLIKKGFKNEKKWAGKWLVSQFHFTPSRREIKTQCLTLAPWRSLREIFSN